MEYIKLADLLFSFLWYLFFAYIYSRNDHILIRKNLGSEYIFDLSFLGLIIGLFFARLVYILGHPGKAFLNPLVFIIFWSFPGLVFEGGFLGSILFIFFLTKKRKIPLGRIMDILALAFLPASIIYQCIILVVTGIMHKHIVYWEFMPEFFYFIVYIFIRWFFVRNMWRPGIVFIWSLFLYSLINITRKLIVFHLSKNFFVYSVWWIGFLLVSTILIVREIMIGLKKN